MATAVTLGSTAKIGRDWQLQVSGRSRHRSRFQAWSTVQNCIDIFNSSTSERLRTIWNDKHISLSSKLRVMRSLVISVLLYASETRTLTADILEKLHVTELRCFGDCLASHTGTTTLTTQSGTESAL